MGKTRIILIVAQLHDPADESEYQTKCKLCEETIGFSSGVIQAATIFTQVDPDSRVVAMCEACTDIAAAANERLEKQRDDFINRMLDEETDDKELLN